MTTRSALAPSFDTPQPTGAHCRSERAWQTGFAALRRHVAAGGDTRIPCRFVDADGFALGAWVLRQRADYRAGNMLPSREQQLSKIDGWTWNRRRRPNPEPPERAAVWREHYDALLKYVDTEGRLPSKHYVTDAQLHLGDWTWRQRRNRRHLSQERIALLESVACWQWWTPGHIATQSRRRATYLAALRVFAEQNGHTNPRATYRTDSGLPLGSWVCAQRHKHRQGILSVTGARELETIPGWTWSTPPLPLSENRRDPSALYFAKQLRTLLASKALEHGPVWNRPGKPTVRALHQRLSEEFPQVDITMSRLYACYRGDRTAQADLIEALATLFRVPPTHFIAPTDFAERAKAS